MARPLPALATAFSTEIRAAEELISQIESAKASDKIIQLSTTELAYELAFLRIFLAWEGFLEQVFIRLLCGFELRGQQEPLIGGAYARTKNVAERRILGRKDYILWHSPSQVIRRAQGYFRNGNFELIIASNQARLEHFAAIRHRIAHAQSHARIEFGVATMQLCGRRYRGERPGRFLRDWDPGASTRQRWIASISSELLSLAQQMCS